MGQHNHSIRAALLAGSMLAAGPVLAADVTPQRLVNADKEPQNWLMNHRTYDGQRFSPLDKINKANVKGLKLAYAVPLGGTRQRNSSRRRRSPRTASSTSPIPGACSTRSTAPRATSAASSGGWIPSRRRQRQSWRRVLGQSRHLARQLTGPHHRDRQGHRQGRVGDQIVDGQSGVRITGAPLAIKDKIIIGASGGDRGVRDWMAALDAATGRLLWRKYTIPAPGEPGSETWKGKNNAWQTGGGAVWVTGTYDPATNQTIWGIGNPVPMMDARRGRATTSITNSAISYDPDDRQDELVFPVHARRHVGLRRGRHPHPRRQRGRRAAAQARHPFGAQRLPLHHGAPNGAMVGAKPYMDDVNWTKGIDQKTGKPLDYDPSKDVQTYSGSPIRPPTRRSSGSVPIAPAATTTCRRLQSRRPRCSTFPA